MTTATGDAPAMASCVSSVLDAVRRGRALSDALTDLATGGQSRAHVPPTAMAATVLRTCADLGGPAAGPLDRVAAMLRVRAAVADEQAAQSAQARLSARVLTVVPVALLGLLLVTDHRVRAAVATAAGGAAIAAGLGLNLVGWWWMRRIVGGTTLTVALLVAAAVALAGRAVLAAPIHGETSRWRAFSDSGDAPSARAIWRRHRSVAVGRPDRRGHAGRGGHRPGRR